MNIDEAISFCSEKSKNIKLKTEPQTFIDIANMLEELKDLRKGKADAIDEFVEFCHKVDCPNKNCIQYEDLCCFGCLAKLFKEQK